MSTAPSFHIQDKRQFRQAIDELERRRAESLRLWRPQPKQLQFLLSDAYEKIVRGGVRSGKTMVASAEVASAATGIPLTGPDDREIPFIYPRRPLLIWVIGYDERHIARIYKKLFRPGQFRLIQDQETGKLRAWRPWEESDAARKAETAPAPPLIPPRLIDAKGWAWDGKVEGCFKMCRLRNGTEIHAFASGAEAAQGEAVDLIWIDEDVKIEGHIDEWQGRLDDDLARLLWSVWPHTVNQGLRRMSRRAAEEAGSARPRVFEIVLEITENPFLSQERTEAKIAAWRAKGEHVVAARARGEFIDDLVLVFPGFSEDVHCLPSRAEKKDDLEIFLAIRGYKVPIEWTNYLVLDPAHTQPAVLFAAVPPPDIFGRRVVVWDELYEPRIDATQLADLVAEKIAGRAFEAFIIDFRAGRQTAIGVGERIVDIYQKAFAKKRICSRLTGSGFAFGSDNIGARNMRVRQWLGRDDDSGSPVLRLIRDTTPAMQNEFALYKKRVTRDDVKEDVVDKDNHLMDCVGYLAAYDPEYVEPETTEPIHDFAYRQWKKIERDSRKDDGVIYLGAGAAPRREDFALAGSEHDFWN